MGIRINTSLPPIIGIVLLNLLVLGMMALSLQRSRAHYDEQAMASTQSLASALEQTMDSALDRIDLALLNIAVEVEKQLASGKVDANQLNALISRQHRWQPDLDSLRVTDSQGNVLYGVGVDARARPPISAADRDYFLRLRQEPDAGLVFSKPVLGKISGKWVIIMARRIQAPDGGFAGVVYGPIALERVYRFFEQIDVGRNGVISVRDSELGVIVRRPELGAIGSSVGNKDVSREIRELIAAGRTDATYFTAQGTGKVARMVSYRKIAEHPFYIVVGLARDEYLSKWYDEVLQQAVMAALFILASIAFAWLLQRNLSHRVFTRKLERLVRERTAQLSAMTMEVTLAEERERRLLAQDLHDDLGQILAMAKLKVTALEEPDGAAWEEHLQQIKGIEAMIDQANHSVRSLSLQLSPPVLHQLGLIPALEWLAEEVYRSYGLAVMVRDDGRAKPLDQVAGYMLFRVVRELLINVAKHAGVQRADVSVEIVDGNLIVSVSDSGSGFDAKKKVVPSAGGGYGLFSVRERIRHIGGEMHIDSSPGDGTVVVLILPLGKQGKELGK